MSIKMYWQPIAEGSPEEIAEACKAKPLPGTMAWCIKPPQDLEEFEDRLKHWVENLHKLGFGFGYEIGKGKTTKRDNSIGSLLGFLTCKEYQKKEVLEYSTKKGYSFLREVLENNGVLRVPDWYLLGVERDFSPITDPVKKMTQVQCFAQVLLYLKGKEIKDRDMLIDSIRREGRLLWELPLFDKKTIRNWIKEMFPDFRGRSVGRPSKYKSQASALLESEQNINVLRLVPNVFIDNGKCINFLKFRLVVRTLAQSLGHFGFSHKKILNSPLMKLYSEQSSLQFYIHHFINNWISSN